MFYFEVHPTPDMDGTLEFDSADGKIISDLLTDYALAFIQEKTREDERKLGDRSSTTESNLPEPPAIVVPTSRPSHSRNKSSASANKMVADQPLHQPRKLWLLSLGNKNKASDPELKRIQSPEQLEAYIIAHPTSLSTTIIFHLMMKIVFLTSCPALSRTFSATSVHVSKWLVSVLQQHYSNPCLAEAGCWAIGNLAFDVNFRTRLGSCGACEVVMQVLRTHFSSNSPIAEVVTKALRAAYNLSFQRNEGNIAILRNSGLKTLCSSIISSNNLTHDAIYICSFQNICG